MSVQLPVLRRIRHLLQGPCIEAPRWREHRRMFDHAVLLVYVFYAVTAYSLYSESHALTFLAGPVENLDLIWPVLWMRYVPLTSAVWVLFHLALVAGLMGLLFWRFLAVRILVSVTLLQFMALRLSIDGFGHGLHEWFWISVCFWFLPTGRKGDIEAQRLGRIDFLYAFGFAPALILFFYTLSGLYKILHASVALSQGVVGGFSPSAMAVTIAQRALETGAEPMWAGVIIDMPLLGWPPYLGLYFIEVFSIAVFFRPSLHRVWGVILIGFHFGTLLFLDIVFPLHILINALFFVMSPFAPNDPGWRSMLAAVPVFGGLFRLGFGWSAKFARINSRAVSG